MDENVLQLQRGGRAPHPSAVTLFPLRFMESLYYIDFKRPCLLFPVRGPSTVMSVSKITQNPKGPYYREELPDIFTAAAPADP